MYFQRYYLGCLAHASYLIGDPKSGVAVVVDPQRDVDQYVTDAKANGLRIEHVFLTHLHADFLAGHLELRAKTGAQIHLSHKVDAKFSFTPARDGQVLRLGQVRLEVLETPGHTPEGVSLLVFDEEKDPKRPHAVLTGDTLFIGDVGRPDLMASVGVTAESLARQLYHSLHDKLLALPDETLVYPAHGAGSMCGKSLSSEPYSTIGEQKLHNYATQPMPEDEFVRRVTADLPDAPAYFAYDAQLNKADRPTLEESLATSLRALSVEQVQQLAREGAQLLDVRDPVEYAGAHLLGAVNIGLSGKFASWAGTLLDRERPIVLIAGPGREREAALRLGRIGLDRVAGFLEGGMQAAAAFPDWVRQTERLSARDLEERVHQRAPTTVIDVRLPNEREAGHIPGSVHVPLATLPRKLAELPRQGQLVVHCASGYRSSIAVSLLEGAGFTGVADLAGGYEAWKQLPAHPAGPSAR